METKNNLLNFLKGVGCFAVVFIHVKFPGLFGTLVWRLAQFAVPIFFMTSGYYAYSPDRSQMMKMLSRRRKRIFRISVISMGIYALTIVLFNIFMRKTINSMVPTGDLLPAITPFFRFLFLNDCDIFGCGHLWFLWALLYTYGILLIVNRGNYWEWAYRTIRWLFILQIIVYAIRSYYGLSWHVSGNWLIGALPFVLMGHWVAAHLEWLSCFSDSWLISLALIGAVVSLGTLAEPTIDLSTIGIVMLSISLFLLAIKNPSIVGQCFFTDVGEKYSLYIYIIHILVKAVVWKLLGAVHISENAIVLWLFPLMVAGCSLVLSKLMLYAQRVGFFIQKG